MHSFHWLMDLQLLFLFSVEFLFCGFAHPLADDKEHEQQHRAWTWVKSTHSHRVPHTKADCVRSSGHRKKLIGPSAWEDGGKFASCVLFFLYSLVFFLGFFLISSLWLVLLFSFLFLDFSLFFFLPLSFYFLPSHAIPLPLFLPPYCCSFPLLILFSPSWVNYVYAFLFLSIVHIQQSINCMYFTILKLGRESIVISLSPLISSVKFVIWKALHHDHHQHLSLWLSMTMMMTVQFFLFGLGNHLIFKIWTVK